MKKIFITRYIPGNGPEMLKAKGWEVVVNPYDRVLTRDELKQNVKGCNAILSMLTDKMDAEIMDAAGPDLKVIANFAVGYDNFVTADGKSKGIFMTNTPDVLTETVAEHTFALMLAIAHRIPESEKFLRAGKYIGWTPTLFLGNDISKKTLGVVGLGRIGSMVAKHASKGFEMKVMYYDLKRNEEFEKEFNATYGTVEEVLKGSDFISVHVPLLPTTKHLIDKAKLAMMKPTAYLVNTSRGPIIDEAALVEALKNKIIKGAALDVFEAEPKLAPGLAELDNVVITPHTASATEETRGKMGEVAAHNIIETLEGRTPPNNVAK
jgi:lactate dehydrogenase-like 2-hydroxyacid dehydrogenase